MIVFIIVVALCSPFSVSTYKICDTIKSTAEKKPSYRLILCNRKSMKNEIGSLCFRNPDKRSFLEKLSDHTFSQVFAFAHYLTIVKKLHEKVPKANTLFEVSTKTYFQDLQASNGKRPLDRRLNSMVDYEREFGNKKTEEILSALDGLSEIRYVRHAAHWISFSILPKDKKVLQDSDVNSLFCELSICNAITMEMPSIVNLIFDQIIKNWQIKTANRYFNNINSFYSEKTFIKAEVPKLKMMFEEKKRENAKSRVYIAITNFIIKVLDDVLKLNPPRNVLTQSQKCSTEFFRNQ